MDFLSLGRSGPAIPHRRIAHYCFGLIFLFAGIFASGAAFVRSSGAEFPDLFVRRSFSPMLAYLVITSTIGFPASMISTRSALGGSRNQFIDFSLVPIFVLSIGYLLYNQKDTTIIMYVGVVGCVGGCALVLSSLRHGTSDQPAWPKGWSKSHSLALGIGCAAASSLCGALSFTFLGELAKKMSPDVILICRLVPSGIMLLIIGVIAERLKWRVSVYGALLSVLLAILIFLFFWILIVLLERETAAQIAPFLFLIPLFVFISSIFPFKLRKINSVPWAELGGMAIIIGGLSLVEVAPWLCRTLPDDTKAFFCGGALE